MRLLDLLDTLPVKDAGTNTSNTQTEMCHPPSHTHTKADKRQKRQEHSERYKFYEAPPQS
jgi:hypothetical protein